MSKFKPTPEVQALRDQRAKMLRRSRFQIRELRKTLGALTISGIDLLQAGHTVYDKHPAYQDTIEPLLTEARRMCLLGGFDFLYQTRTPLPEEPNMTEAICGIHDEGTETMMACIELIRDREVIAITKDRGNVEARLSQRKASDNDDSQNASEQGK